MKKKAIGLFAFITTICIMSMVVGCSCQDVDDKQKYPQIEAVAKEQAMQLADSIIISRMQIQHKLFEVRAHEQKLRNAGMNEEADVYIERFIYYLNTYNPDLAGEINTKNKQ